MAENIKREGARLRDYFGRETIRGLLATAEKDPDRSTGAPPPSGCQAARDGDPLDCEET